MDEELLERLYDADTQWWYEYYYGFRPQKREDEEYE